MTKCPECNAPLKKVVNPHTGVAGAVCTKPKNLIVAKRFSDGQCSYRLPNRRRPDGSYIHYICGDFLPHGYLVWMDMPADVKAEAIRTNKFPARSNAPEPTKTM